MYFFPMPALLALTTCVVGRLRFTGWLLAVLTGCSAPPPGDTIHFWAMGREGEAVQVLLAEFERRHPGIRVRVQQIPWSAAHEKLLTAFAGDALPDVIQLGNTWVPEFAALDALRPLDDRIDGVADLFPGMLEGSRVEGRLLALPWYVDTRLLFYRQDILARAGYDRPPVTWEGWREAMARIKDQSGPDHYALLLPINEWQAPVILALQAGSGLLRDTARYGDFRGPAFRRAFGVYLDMFRQGFAPALAEAQMSNLYQDFAQGRFAFFITGPWNIGEFQRRLPPALQTVWETAPLPGPEGPGLSLAGGSSLAVTRASRHPEAALALIRFLAEPGQQAAFYRLTGDLPGRRSAWDQPELRNAPHLDAFRQQLAAVTPTPGIPEWERIAAQIAFHAEKVVRGELSEEQALTELDAAVDRILAKRRWLLSRGAAPGGSSP